MVDRQERPRLNVKREEATRVLAGLYLEGSKKRETLTDRKQWSQYTAEYLRKIFTTDEPAIEFEKAQHVPVSRSSGKGVMDLEERKRFDGQLGVLNSIQRRMELYDLATPSSGGRRSASAGNRAVFIVHGHDGAAKEAVARFLARLDLNPIILHEQANRGRTIAQKFQDHADVEFAVVLLTPDDEGRLKGSPELKPRARQNVIFELGYFRGRLGHEHVCALMVDGVEQPSDLDGVLYVPFDERGAWQLTLARELKAANIDVDLNLAI